MATMEETQVFENRILERLNARLTVKGFIEAAVSLLADAVDLLILQVFRKDDYAVKYAVEPLLEGSGPLAALPVRLKLIYALGVITRDEYEDVELLLALNNELLNIQDNLSFTDDEVLGPLHMLHGITLPPPPVLNLPEDVIDDKLVDMQLQRYQQAIRSTLVLYITDLLSRLGHKKAF
ncbi:MltR family transcriptional regulator [Budviciaceae bacterium CWB-B4]|uniref:MltR family transcriptional regulator n=1 Tax=Limnobaculum xujianqingii TaxID=2738837 RepID=A0A9D7FQM1_9GAMM|nr:MltR family transcriptional regulator [Limnobaculum xujianqingii]MBK5071700.1 MltR family transcriptional regulator [Limnobaculum xujianqingii]MBK5175009.1 MltR family transcriptional regulator [Limnobaculum xujianqingii]